MKPRERAADRERLLGRVQESLACRVSERRPGQLVIEGLPEEGPGADWLDRRKGIAKRALGGLYPAAVRLLSPVCWADRVPGFLASFDLEQELVADLGCGTNAYDERVVGVDGVDYANVHVVARLTSLPFKSDSLSGVICLGVLEHARDPRAIVREMRRVLKPGGRALCAAPFMQGFHASPGDYQRYTQEGLRELFSEFEVLACGVSSGPTSGMLWALEEWLALALSLGSRRLYRALVPVFWLLSPLKWLDVLLAKHPDAHVIAGENFIEARKPS